MLSFFLYMQVVVLMLIFAVLWISKQKALSEGMPLFAINSLFLLQFYLFYFLRIQSFLHNVCVCNVRCLHGRNCADDRQEVT